MTGTKHTPGPWVWHYKTEDGENNGSVIWMKREGMAYCVAKAPRYQAEEQWNADARLIAAAPELLEALGKMCFAYKELCKITDKDLHEDEAGIYLHTMSILAKAKGKAK